jgi:hypothetical protein
VGIQIVLIFWVSAKGYREVAEQQQKTDRKNKEGTVEIRALVNSKAFKDQLARALPKHISARTLCTYHFDAASANSEPSKLRSRFIDCKMPGSGSAWARA